MASTSIDPSFFPTPSPPPPGQQQPVKPPPNSSNLYLVTFLATLFLLLFVSCAIVLRSYVMRRRLRRRIEEAHALGIVLTPRAQGSKRRRFGAKPKMFDVWISEGGCKWNDIMPLMAQPLLVKRRYKDKPAPPSSDPEAPANESPPVDVPNSTMPRSAVVPSASSRAVTIIHSLFHRRTSPPPTQPLIAQPEKPLYRIRTEMLQVGVLVAMPSRPLLDDNSTEKQSMQDGYDDEQNLPELVIGVTRMYYRPPKTPS